VPGGQKAYIIISALSSSGPGKPEYHSLAYDCPGRCLSEGILGVFEEGPAYLDLQPIPEQIKRHWCPNSEGCVYDTNCPMVCPFDKTKDEQEEQ
jgi:hypothetical protein